MRNVFAICILIAALTACGGGSGSVSPPTVKPTPTVAPPLSYTAHVKFYGGTSLHSVSSIRNVQQTILHPMNTVGDLPIEISVVAPSGSVQANDQRTGGILSIAVSPAPSPQAPISIGSSGVAVNASPQPFPSPQPTDPQRFAITTSNLTTPTSGTVNVTVGTPVSLTDNIPIYVLPRSIVSCGVNHFGGGAVLSGSDTEGGLHFVNGVAQTATSTSAADFYIDGPNCTENGFLNAGESEVTLHFPYGAVFLSSASSPYATLLSTLWTNAITSVGFTTFNHDLVDPATPKDIILFKTVGGSIVKLAFYDTNNVTGQQLVYMSFAYQQSGFSVDGF